MTASLGTAPAPLAPGASVRPRQVSRRLRQQLQQQQQLGSSRCSRSRPWPAAAAAAAGCGAAPCWPLQPCRRRQLAGPLASASAAAGAGGHHSASGGGGGGTSSSSGGASTGATAGGGGGGGGGAAGAGAGAGAAAASGSANAAANAAAAAANAGNVSGFALKPMAVAVFGLLFVGGLLFASMSLQLTSELGFRDALTKVLRRIFRSIAFRQLVVITACILLVRFALNNVLRFLARWSSSPVPWDKSKMYYVAKEIYSPLELLLFIAGCCTIADSFVPQLVNVPKATVTHVVRAVLSMSFVVGAAVVVFNLKSRFCKEQAWSCEVQGDVTSQRRWEAYDKLGTFAIYVVGTILAIQALGLEVRSVLAIGGIGGLAIGLAGREICENLLNGFLLMTTMPFEVGEEVMFRPKPNELIEGIVVDVGWYRTLIRSFEREMYVIPNAVFSRNTVLNVTRKAREWRFYEFLCVRVADVHKVNAIIQDIRRIVRNDARIMNKLHRRVFLDKISLEDVKVYISFYVEASNRDAFMAVKQDLLLAFVDCVERNGAKLAQPKTVLELEPGATDALLSSRLMGLGGAGALLPGPGGTGGFGGAFGVRGAGAGGGLGAYGGTVQVVDSVEVSATPIDASDRVVVDARADGGSSGSGSSGKDGGKDSGKDGSSSGKAGAADKAASNGSSGGGGKDGAAKATAGSTASTTTTTTSSSSKAAAVDKASSSGAGGGSASVPRPSTPTGDRAAAGAAGASSAGGSSSSGKAAAGAAAPSDKAAVQPRSKGDGGAPASSTAAVPAATAAGADAKQRSAAAVATVAAAATAPAPAGTPAAAAAVAAAAATAAAPPRASSPRNASPSPPPGYAVVSAPAPGTTAGGGGGQLQPQDQRPDAVTILASFEEL